MTATTPTLQSTVRSLLAPGKGILAADESFPTIEKHFAAFSIRATEGNRRAYRESLCTAPGLETFISGTIHFDETLRRCRVVSWRETRFPQPLEARSAATQRLNAIRRTRGQPWKLSFSFDRAPQDAAMRCNSLAVQGRYSAQMERAGTGDDQDSHPHQRTLAVSATDNPIL